jgi:hypothetical protein
MSKWTDGGLITNCQEQETKSIVENGEILGWMHLMVIFNIAFHICDLCNEYWPYIYTWRDDLITTYTKD